MIVLGAAGAPGAAGAAGAPGAAGAAGAPGAAGAADAPGAAEVISDAKAAFASVISSSQKGHSSGIFPRTSFTFLPQKGHWMESEAPAGLKHMIKSFLENII